MTIASGSVSQFNQMAAALRAAAEGVLVCQLNHPSTCVLGKHAYLQRLEEAEPRAGRYVKIRWRVSESGRVRLTTLTMEM